MSRHLAWIRVSEDVLLDWLQFRQGHILRADQKDWDISFLIEHPDLPECEEDKPIAEVTPIYTYTYGTSGELLAVVREKEKYD